MNQENLKRALEDTARERGIETDVLVSAISFGITIAVQRKTGLGNLKAFFNSEKERFEMALVKTVKEDVTDPAREITPEQAIEYDGNAKIGEEVAIPYPFPDLGRLAAQTTRKVMKKAIYDIEASHEFEQKGKHKHRLTVAIVRQKNEEGDYLCNVAEEPAVLPVNEQAFRESFAVGEVIKTVVVDVTRTGNDSIFVLSRTHPLLLRFLLTREVPEITDRLVEIKSIARDTAGRSKVAVFSTDPKIDAEGACIGPGGSRIKRITEELKGENIDIIPWSEKPEEFIAASLKPAVVKSVKCDEEKFEASVELEPGQQAKAVGKKGLNIRLASHLTHWKIHIS